VIVSATEATALRQFTNIYLLSIRVATNLEYSGISLNTENSGNSVQP